MWMLHWILYGSDFPIAASVIGIDENQDHIDTANENLAKLEIDNAGVILRDLIDGYPEQKYYGFNL